MSETRLEALYYFVVLAESSHFGEAASRLCMTQQALSKSIKQLEAQLGVSLFLRQGRRRQLSPAGRQLRVKARELLAQSEQIERYFMPVSRGEPTQVLRLAAPLFPRLPVMPVIRRYLAAHPRLQITCDQALLPEAMEQALLAGELDCAFYQQPPLLSRLNAEVISSRCFRLVAHPAHNPEARWDSCGYIRYLPVFKPYEALFWPIEMQTLPVVAEADHDTALHLCHQGKGVLYLPESFVRHRLQSRQLIQLPPPPFEHALDTWLIWPAEQDPDSLSGRFVADVLARREAWAADESKVAGP